MKRARSRVNPQIPNTLPPHRTARSRNKSCVDLILSCVRLPNPPYEANPLRALTRIMTPDQLLQLLDQYRKGDIDATHVLHAVQSQPTIDLGFASLDTQRELRKGFPEVVYGAGKTPDHVVQIVARLYETHGRVLVTRASFEQAQRVIERFPNTEYHPTARCITLGALAKTRPNPDLPPSIAIICAGTSDLPVAEEAAVTAEFLGDTVDRHHDVGVAGLHRLLARLPKLQQARVLICVAGMEGALPSVVAGLLPQPVIGVPTSVGYGAHFNGLTPLLAMLNSCSSGLTVVNIDNGFGAACAAHAICSVSRPGGG